MKLKLGDIVPNVALGLLAGVFLRFVAFLYFYPAAMAREIGWNTITSVRWASILDFSNPTDFQSLVMILLVRYGTGLGVISVIVFTLLSYTASVSNKRMLLTFLILVLAVAVLSLQYFVELSFKSPLILGQ